MAPFSASRWAWFTAALVLLTAGAPAPAQNGHTLNGAGPVSRSMAGASTAMPVDASGALYWNPAAVSGLERSEVDLGLTTLQPIVRLTSAVAPGALGPGVPPVGLAGSTTSDTDFVPMPAFAFVWQPEESEWTFGLGMFTIAGLGVK